MMIVDANVLLYAMSAPSEHHRTSRSWLDDALNGTESVGLPWLSIVAFVRLSTLRTVLPVPLTPDESFGVVESWLAQPPAVLLEPGPNHLATMRRLIAAMGRAGNLVNDAHLAALALEYDGEVVTFDSDLGRFPGVRWRTP